MSDNIDSQLLRSFVQQRSEAAFADLVRRHLDIVHSAALRHVGGDTHRAQDVTQAVFLELTRKAPALVGRTSLAGWLYTTACHVASRAQRSEQRRARREFASQMTQPRTEEAAWESLRPVLDDAMHRLSGTDREAVLLRFFQNRSFSEIGAALGLRENAARMRVDRALEKLRRQLGRRGLTSTAAMLAGVLSSNAVRPAPEGFASSVVDLAFRMASASAAASAPARLAAWLGSGKAWLATGTAVLVFAAVTPSLRRTEAEPAVRVRFTTRPPNPGPEVSRPGRPSAPQWLWASVESP